MNKPITVSLGVEKLERIKKNIFGENKEEKPKFEYKSGNLFISFGPCPQDDRNVSFKLSIYKENMSGVSSQIETLLVLSVPVGLPARWFLSYLIDNTLFKSKEALEIEFDNSDLKKLEEARDKRTYYVHPSKEKDWNRNNKDWTMSMSVMALGRSIVLGRDRSGHTSVRCFEDNWEGAVVEQEGQDLEYIPILEDFIESLKKRYNNYVFYPRIYEIIGERLSGFYSTVIRKQITTNNN